jgi:acyl carrier protein
MDTAQVEEEVRLLWRDVLPSGNFNEDSDFISAGGSSLKVMSLFVKLKKKFSVTLEVKNFNVLNTISKQSAFISSELQTRTHV